jgi:endonuclease-3 related protein
LLLGRYGKQGWWPGDGRFEVVVGAILTQNTNWGNVEKAIGRLKSAGCLDAKAMYEMEVGELGELIRPSGYYKVKAGRLKNFLGWLFDNYGGDVDAVADFNVHSLREELLGIKGIGPETADSILLYGFGKSTFVVDTYTCRIAARHLLIEPGAGYDEVKDFFESNLSGDVELYNEFHALIVRVGKEHCKPKAVCAGCPLERLPHEVDPECF